MMQFQTVGLIVNPVAGQGMEANISLARRGLAALAPREVFTGVGSIGAAALMGLSCDTVILPINEQASRNQSQGLAGSLATQKMDAVIVVGGDGTLADVAYVFSQIDDSPPLLGIGAGSTNAGTLITCTADQIDSLTPTMLEAVAVNALLAHVGDDLVGVGFNDCVLGFTVVATIDGLLRDVGVAEKFAGQNVPARPAPIGLRHTRVERFGSQSCQTIAFGESVATVIVGLAEPSFIAKAITGGVCLTAFTGLQAGCLVADRPLVQVELKASDVLALPPIHSSFISFNEQESIHIRGVREGAGLCVDGTPLRLLTPEQEISFGVRPNAVRAVKFVNKKQGAL